jgi:hypothetical protein
VLLTFTATTRFTGVPDSPVNGLCARKRTAGAEADARVLGVWVLGACVFASGALPFIATASTLAPMPRATTRDTATIFALGVWSHCGILMGAVYGAGPSQAGLNNQQDLAGDVALEASDDLGLGQPLGGASPRADRGGCLASARLTSLLPSIATV